MGKEIITFADIEIKKQRFHSHKNPISIYDVDINKIVASIKVPFSKIDLKYCIGYKDLTKIRPLYIMLSKISIYRREFDETKYMSLLIKNVELLEK